MSTEQEFDRTDIAKGNRRNNQEAEKGREKSHPFKLHPHKTNEKHRAVRRKNMENKARKRG